VLKIKKLIFIIVGIFLINLSFGCISFEDKSENISKFKPEIDAGKDQIGYANITIYFNVSLNNDKNFYKYYTWDYNGDGIVEENNTGLSRDLIMSLYEYSHYCYSKPGKYIATVKIVDRNESIAKDSCNVTILPDPIEFTITMNKSTYNVSESIFIKSVLYNNNEIYPITVEDMMFLRGSLDFFIITPDNYSLKHTGYLISLAPSYIEILPDSIYEIETEITNSSFTFGNISNGITNFQFEMKGEYSVSVEYTAHSSCPNTWNGKIISNSVKFMII
jgi:hypothetical protein